MALPASPNRYQSAEERRREKAARRRVLVQCEKCKCNGSGQATSTGRIVSVNLAAEFYRGWNHRNCGGRFIAFDIEVGA